LLAKKKGKHCQRRGKENKFELKSVCRGKGNVTQRLRRKISQPTPERGQSNRRSAEKKAFGASKRKAIEKGGMRLENGDEICAISEGWGRGEREGPTKRKKGNPNEKGDGRVGAKCTGNGDAAGRERDSEKGFAEKKTVYHHERKGNRGGMVVAREEVITRGEEGGHLSP